MRRGTRSWEQSREIQRLAGEGLSTREISQAMGISQPRVIRIANRFNLILTRGRHRRIAFYTPESRFETVRGLAAAAGVSPATMVDRIVATVVEGGVDAARRKLGKLALPTRPRDDGRG
jgi:hypothetical protein